MMPPRPPNRLVPPMTTAVMVSVGAHDRVRTRRPSPADHHPGGKAVDQPGHGMAEQHLVDLDTDQPGGLDVVADGVLVRQPQLVWLSTKATTTHERGHNDYADSQAERADREPGAHRVEDGGHVVPARRWLPPEYRRPMAV